MVNVADYKRGQWLKSDDIKTGEIIIIKNEGEFVDDNFNEGKKVLEILVELPNGSELIAKPNKTSVSALSDLENGGWGDDVANWVGKQAIVEIKQEVVKGEDRDVIYLIPNDDGATQTPNQGSINQDEIPVHDPIDPNEEAQIAK